MTDGGYPTSYFSEPEPQLDSRLFQGRYIQPWVRQGILSLIYGFLGKKFRHPEIWSHAWLAGSGVSYQWSADRDPSDLDCLVGVDYVQFRKANPSYQGLSDVEISQEINDDFHSGLEPETENWNGFELTFYVNPGATDIRSIKPYAAYDLKYDEWTVHPSPNQKAPTNSAWEAVVASDRAHAEQISTRFTTALNDAQMSHNDATRRNAEARLSASAQQGIALFDEIHLNRSQAFSSSGEGYSDFHNYRWQAGKREGTIQTLRLIRERVKNMQTSKEASTYGVSLPNAETLIRRAATYRNQV